MASKRRVVARWLRIKVRSSARRALGGAIYGVSVAWGLAFFVIYTPLALVAAGAVMVGTALVAAVAVLFSGE